MVSSVSGAAVTATGGLERGSPALVAATCNQNAEKPTSRNSNHEPPSLVNKTPERRREPELEDSPLWAAASAGAGSLGAAAAMDDTAVTDTPSLRPAKSPPLLSRTASFGSDYDAFPPLDRLGMLDLLDNFALPAHLEKLQRSVSAQTGKIRSKSQRTRDLVAEEWRRRVPTADEQLERYRRRMRASVDSLAQRWSDARTVTLREKISFICGVMNVFISGFLIGGYPEVFHLWYTVQLAYFMPIRFYAYRRRGYHYFLADLCYFVNMLLTLCIWVFPRSERLLISTYCLSYGNNAIAIIMWRNSLVFHSFDKVTSLFIHIMPCATLHCIVHLWDAARQRDRFPAAYQLKHMSSMTWPQMLMTMLLWSSLPYAIWQLSYYFMITVRRRDKILAGRPTSFTWLRRSYSRTWIGKFVLSLPESFQEAAFMLIQYCYAVLTMLPCPIWFTFRYASSSFMFLVFALSVHNGATYYIDIFGKRFQNELEAMKRDLARMQQDGGNGTGIHSAASTPGLDTPVLRPVDAGNLSSTGSYSNLASPAATAAGLTMKMAGILDGPGALLSPPVQAVGTTATGIDGGMRDVVKERKKMDRELVS